MKKKINKYLAVFEEEQDSGFSVWVPDLPGCTSQGDNLEDAIANIKEAMGLYLENSPNHSVDNNPTKRQFILPVNIFYA
ncbi:MAG: type II toxin-antitoxin system HicB family antitoxin [Patescibacteria group bacterium]